MRDLATKFLRYIMTGGTAAIVDAGGFALLLKLGVPVLAAGIASFCAAALVNYLLTARFVFHQPARPRGFATFFVASLGGLTVNVCVTLAAVAFLGLPPIVGKIMGIGCAFLINFALNVGVVFRAKAVEPGLDPVSSTIEP